MKIVLLSGCGFIGTNLALKLSEEKQNYITVVGSNEEHFTSIKRQCRSNICFKKGSFDLETDFDSQVRGQDVVYHLASTIIPGTSNLHIPDELNSNVVVTAKLLDACVRQKVKRVIFFSSGGTVYGKKGSYPINEDMVTYPITSYGIQKLVVEKMLYLYRYQFGMDYRVIRISNPYGPYQRPNGRLGVITTFVYKALTDGIIEVYGDGSVVRDFIYIDDAIKGVIKIANGENDYRIFNLGSGKGTSVNEVIELIRDTIRPDLQIRYISARKTDVPVNYLNIDRYESIYGKLEPINLRDGILRTANFIRKQLDGEK